ncbi:MAG TPA: DUF3040 domain-containing protein [Microbacteriaceae bacterium]|nr:DUF3040 domain-containing protein [Microbacteriaceae bacterium]
MALSEHEQRLLEEMERNFHLNGPESAPIGRGQVDYTAVTIGALVVVAGIALAVIGVASQMWWLGIVGFVIMFGGALLMLRRRASASDAAPRAGREPRGGNEFMTAFERRWDQRQDRRDDAE